MKNSSLYTKKRAWDDMRAVTVSRLQAPKRTIHTVSRRKPCQSATCPFRGLFGFPGSARQAASACPAKNAITQEKLGFGTAQRAVDSFEAKGTKKNDKKMHGFEARMPICQFHLWALFRGPAVDQLANATFYVTKNKMFQSY